MGDNRRVEEGQVLFRVQGLTTQRLFTCGFFALEHPPEASVTLSTTSIAASHLAAAAIEGQWFGKCFTPHFSWASAC